MGQFNPIVHGPRAAPHTETHEVRLLRGLARNLSALLDLKNLSLETARKDDWHVCTRLSYVAGDPCPACDEASDSTMAHPFHWVEDCRLGVSNLLSMYEEAARDSRRLDWLENWRRGVEAVTADDERGEPTRKLWAVDGTLPNAMRDTLRAAIDAAFADTAFPTYGDICRGCNHGRWVHLDGERCVAAAFADVPDCPCTEFTPR